MIHPHTELRYINDTIGYGVFATRFIPKGTILWAMDDVDQIIKRTTVDTLDPMLKANVKKYAFRNQDGDYVLCWDNGKFLNHSFHATCVATAYDIELAARDIFPGEEITDDYGTLNMDEPFQCLPEPDTQRTIVMPDDLLRYHEMWDRIALDAFRRFNEVDQPLWHLVKPYMQKKIKAVADGSAMLDSVLALYCRPDDGIPTKQV
ncbi:MAG: SET domain-containing protein [Clostridia bacterium]